METLHKSHEQRLITIDAVVSHDGSPPRCFHGSRPAYPGVGQYNVEQGSLDIRQKSPKAIIGQQKRWRGLNSLNQYKPNLPHNGFESK